MKRLIGILLIVGLLQGCVGFGMLMTTDHNPDPEPHKTQATSKLNYFNLKDRQECLDRGFSWGRTSEGARICK